MKFYSECFTKIASKRYWAEWRNPALYYREADGARQLLLFPEGTNMSHAAKQKSDLYAVENNVAKYKHLLHPRTSGNHAHIWRKKESFSMK